MPARPIDHESGIPLYTQLAEDLRRRLREGEWPLGAPIPSEADLVYEYDLGRNTVRRVLYRLRDEGYLVSRRGERWRAAEQLPNNHGNRERVQLPPGAVVWTEEATAPERARWGLAVGASVFVVHYKAVTRRYAADRTELQAPWRDPNVTHDQESSNGQ